ncbi:MAG TPA: BRO family protein [Burkholderiales bacterium]|nr:BRO family protein [Burkholderiales bacterium]
MGAPYASGGALMDVDFDESERKRKRFRKVATLVGCIVVVAVSVPLLGAFSLFAIAAAVIVLVYTFDAPDVLFAGYYKAKKKVQGVEHEGRHDWYSFHGMTIRVFFDERRKPWMAAKEIAHILAVGGLPDAFRGYRSAEFGKQPFAKGEYCLSEAGLRRLLKSSQHPEAHPMLLWLERDVLFPLRERENRPTP